MESGHSFMGSVITLALIALVLVAFWKVFEKAGRPGWQAIVPFYNLYVLCQIVGWPGWYLVFFLIPLVNMVMTVVLQFKVAGVFKKGVGFAIGLILLPIVFLPILGFGDDTYTAPAPKA
jgi:hypothetical protein